jgi:succinoglycan biosynthesis transport protein ExoP
MAEEVKGFVEHYAGFKRHWKPALAVFVVIMGIGSVFTMSLPDIYRSSGFILIEESEIPEELMRSTVTTYATRQVTTLNEKILTIGNLVGIIERYDLFADERRDEQD